MKKSKYIELVLITSVLASCNKPNKEWEIGNKVFLRGDSSAPYQKTTRHHSSGISPLLWFYAFRPYGSYYNGSYQRAGYYSSGINERSNIGNNSAKNNVVRGGFGSSSHYSVSS